MVAIPRVNLLPPYYLERKRVKQIWALMILLLVFNLGALGLWYRSIQQTNAFTQGQIDQKTPAANRVDQLHQQITAVQSTIAPTQAKTDFVKHVLAYNAQYANVFEGTNRYTYARVGYTQIQPSQTTLGLTAYAQTVGDVGRFLLNAQRGTDLFAAVTVTGGVPGWPQDNSGGSAPAGPAPTAYPYGGSGSEGGAYPGANPYAPSSAYPGGPGGAVGTGAPTGPTPIDFTAVAQLQPKYYFNPPTYGSQGQAAAAGGGSAYPYGPTGYGGVASEGATGGAPPTAGNAPAGNAPAGSAPSGDATTTSSKNAGG